MINYSSKQTGSTHIVIIVILVIALLGALGFVFWQNFVKKGQETNTDSSKNTSTQKPEGRPKDDTLTYRNASIGIEFTYPKTWIKVECDNTYIEDPQNRVYFGTNNEGVGIVNGNSSNLCGGGTDFPPQMTFAVQEGENEAYAESFTNVTVGGKTAKKYVTTSGADSILPGIETTAYVVELNNAKRAIFSYNRFPESKDGSRDNSEVSRQKFTKLVEESLRFL